MSDNLKEENELISSVLSVTREHLSKYMNLATELEALLVIERRKNFELETKIQELKSLKQDKKSDI